MELKLRKAYENATTTFENGRQQTRSITEVRYDIMEGENPVGEAYARPGQLIVAAIEIRSIFEKADAKVKKDVAAVAVLASELARHRTDPDELARAIVKYIKQEETL